MQTTTPPARLRILLLLSSAAAFGALVAVLSCASGSGGFDPIVIDFTVTRTPAPPPPTPTPTPAPVRIEKPQAAPPPASVPAVDLTPPPREKPEPPAPAAESPAEVVARHRQALARGDLAAALALYATDARMETGSGGSPGGRDAIERFLSQQVRSTTSAERIESGSYVAERLTGGVTGLTLYEVRNGKIARIWVFR